MISKMPGSPTPLEIARAVRTACVNSAKDAYNNAAMSGLCDEGALEAAISAIEMLDIEALVEKQLSG